MSTERSLSALTSWPARLVDAAAARAVVCAAAIVFATAMITAPVAPLFDPDEGYYPATAAESLDAGTAWDPVLNGEPRWDKPILTYTLIQASFAAFGRSVTAARLPSALEALLLVAFAGWSVGTLAGRRAGGLAAGVLATTAGIQVFARVAHPEIGVVLAITIAELCAVLWLVEDRLSQRRRLALAGGIVMGLGVLFKGPVAIALPALAVVTASLLMNGVRLPGATAIRHAACAVSVALAVALPWYAAMTWRHGLPFVEDALWRHNVSRFAGTAFVHQSPPWFFVAPTLIAMLPWTAFIPAAFARVRRDARTPADVLRLTMAAAAVTAFAFYSASQSKLPHYALVFTPPLAILIGLRLAAAPPHELRTGMRSTAVVLALGAVALLAAPFAIGHGVGARDLFAALPAAADVRAALEFGVWPAAVVLVLAAAALWRARHPVRTLATCGALLPAVLILGLTPLLESAFPWARFGAELRGSPLPIWVIGPRAPSLSFLAAHQVARMSEQDADERDLPAAEAWLLADNDWFTRREQAHHGDSFERVDASGAMILVRWHGGHIAPHGTH